MELIPEGKENAITRSELAKALHVDVRTISLIIADARRKNYLICSGNEGYYKPSNNSELKAFYNRMRKQSLSMLTALKSARKALKTQGETL